MDWLKRIVKRQPSPSNPQHPSSEPQPSSSNPQHPSSEPQPSNPSSQNERFEQQLTEILNAKAWNGRGLALYYLGRYEEAIFSYDKAIEIKPDLHEVWYIRGLALYYSRFN